HFKDVLVFQQFCESVCASVETGAQNDDLGRALVQCALHMIINEPRTNEQQVRHSGDLTTLSAFLVILTNSSRDGMLGNQLQLDGTNQSFCEPIRIADVSIGFAGAEGSQRRYNNRSPRWLTRTESSSNASHTSRVPLEYWYTPFPTFLPSRPALTYFTSSGHGRYLSPSV